MTEVTKEFIQKNEDERSLKLRLKDFVHLKIILFK